MFVLASSRFLAAVARVALVGCASHLPALPRDASVGRTTTTMPTPEVLGNDAPPRVLAMDLSTLDLRRGTTWRARSYALRVIARNSAGVRSEQDLSLVMQ